MLKISLLLSLFFLSLSCSQLSVQALAGKSPYFVDLHDNDQRTPVEVVVKREFFFWGLVPKNHSVTLNEEFSKLKPYEVSDISYQVEQTWGQALVGVVSFGLYRVVQLRIFAMAKLAEDAPVYSEGRWR